jgi:CubicO group peptidase (beta-lactamase class C family)
MNLKTMFCFAGALLVACGVQGARAQDAAPHALTAADVAAFVDGYLPTEMERAGIDGVSVAVVQDGQVLLARGYGLADREHHVPVTSGTLFRIGSISKLFAWTAVMQLVEQHRLDLDADVQQYIDFELPKTFAQPITLRHLMTHTAGFEERLNGLWASEGESLDLRDYLVARVPARIYAPGSVAAYSNYGATLAGYIVQRRSGEAFDTYVRNHILQPLGMTHTTFAQPLPATLAASMSNGYDHGADPAKPFELIRVAPAGSASASADDMARFMRAELADGSLDGARILQPDTLARMQAAQWWPQPHGPAMALGFWEDGGYGLRVIGHGGDSQWFHAGLYLLPAQHVGLFVVQNSAGKHVLRDVLMRRFMARYFPAPAPVFAARPPPAADLAGMTGHYLGTRRGETGPLALLGLLSQDKVEVAADGTLTLSQGIGLDERPVKYRYLGDGAWQSPDDSTRRLWFRRDAEGQWQMNGRIPAFIEQRVPWTHDAGLARALLALSLLVVVGSLLAWPLAAAARWRFAAPARVSREEGRARIALRIACVLAVLPLLTFALVAMQASESFVWLAGPRALAWLRVAQVESWLALGGIALAAWATRTRWRARGAGWWGRVQAGMVVLACGGLSTLAWLGHLMVGATHL